MSYEPPLDDPIALSNECACGNNTCDQDDTCADTQPLEDRMWGDE